MATDVNKIKLGPCKVTFDVDGTPVVFESTQGGVSLTYTEETREVNIDQFGSTPAKEVVTGRNASIEVPFAEFDLDKLASIIPGSTLTTNGTDPIKKRLDVDASKVIDLFDYAKKVKLEPLDENATANDAVLLYSAAPRPNINYSYNYDNELVTNVTFKAYPASDGKLIGFGDETA